MNTKETTDEQHRIREEQGVAQHREQQRECRARTRAEETPEQREQRVARHREQDRKHPARATAKESEQEREQRLVKVNDVAVMRKSDGKEFQKQDAVIGDETGLCRLVLWEEDVGSLEEGKSYNLLDVVVRM